MIPADNRTRHQFNRIGFAHGDQGETGMITAGGMGLGFDVSYLPGQRNLLFAITTLGLYDSAGFNLVYMGMYPNGGAM